MTIAVKVRSWFNMDSYEVLEKRTYLHSKVRWYIKQNGWHRIEGEWCLFLLKTSKWVDNNPKAIEEARKEADEKLIRHWNLKKAQMLSSNV